MGKKLEIAELCSQIVAVSACPLIYPFPLG
jgi:hypothetical protein